MDTWLVALWGRRKTRIVQYGEAAERDVRASGMIAELQDRKCVVEKFLIQRQQRNHWQDAINEILQR